MKKLLSMLGAVLVLAAGPAARAASVTNSVSDLAIAPDALATLLRSLNTPDTYNRLFLTLTNSVFGGANQSNSYFQFVRDLNLKFKAFDATGAGEKAGLGVEYDYNKSIAGRTIGATNPVGLSLAFHAKGNVAFDQERNPDDFLETGLKFHVFQSRGGWEPRMVEEIPADRTKISPLQQLTDEIYLRKKKGNMTEAERQLDPDWQAFLNYVRNHLDTQFFWDAAGNLALESNQDFSKQQWAYGLQVGGVVRAWRDDSAWARWNVLDWPFATIRFLSGADKEFTPDRKSVV